MFVLALTLAICLLIVLLITYKLLKVKNKPFKLDEIEKFLIWLNDDYEIIPKDPTTPPQVYLSKIHWEHKACCIGKRETT